VLNAKFFQVGDPAAFQSVNVRPAKYGTALFKKIDREVNAFDLVSGESWYQAVNSSLTSIPQARALVFHVWNINAMEYCGLTARKGMLAMTARNGRSQAARGRSSSALGLRRTISALSRVAKATQVA
jgi:hypothetical protein